MKENTKVILPETGFLRLNEILQIIPISRSTWWIWVSEGKAPSPIKLGPRTTAWKAEDIKHLIDTLSSQRSEQNAIANR